MENPTYDLELSDKSKNWVKPQLLKLDKDVFEDMKLSIDESVQILYLIKNINWYDKWKTGYVAALQVLLKSINSIDKSINCDPGALDSVLLKWSMQWSTKKWLAKFQTRYKNNFDNWFKVDWEPWPKSLWAIFNIIKKIKTAEIKPEVKVEEVKPEVTAPELTKVEEVKVEEVKVEEVKVEEVKVDEEEAKIKEEFSTKILERDKKISEISLLVKSVSKLNEGTDLNDKIIEVKKLLLLVNEGIEIHKNILKEFTLNGYFDVFDTNKNTYTLLNNSLAKFIWIRDDNKALLVSLESKVANIESVDELTVNTTVENNDTPELTKKEQIRKIFVDEKIENINEDNFDALIENWLTIEQVRLIIDKFDWEDKAKKFVEVILRYNLMLAIWIDNFKNYSNEDIIRIYEIYLFVSNKTWEYVDEFLTLTESLWTKFIDELLVEIKHYEKENGVWMYVYSDLRWVLGSLKVLTSETWLSLEKVVEMSEIKSFKDIKIISQNPYTMEWLVKIKMILENNGITWFNRKLLVKEENYSPKRDENWKNTYLNILYVNEQGKDLFDLILENKDKLWISTLDNLKLFFEKNVIYEKAGDFPSIKEKIQKMLDGWNTEVLVNQEINEETEVEKSIDLKEVEELLKDWVDGLTFDQMTAINKYLVENKWLVDTSDYISDDLTLLLNQSTLKFTKGWNKYSYIDNDLNKWQLSESAWYKDQYPDGNPWYRQIILKDTTRQKQVVFEYNEFVNNVNSWTFLNKKINSAISDYESEKNDVADIKAFDIPKNEKVLYFSMSDANNHDDVIMWLRKDWEYLWDIIKERNTHQDSVFFNEAIDSNDNPSELLEKQFIYASNNNINNIVLNFLWHWSESYISFSWWKLKISVIKELLLEYPGINVVINTVACHWWGIESLSKLKNLNREWTLTTFLQVQEHVVNQEWRINWVVWENNSPKIFSSYYNIYLHYHLTEFLDKTFWEAHLYADKMAKKLVWNNAQAITNDWKGQVNTTKGL